MKTYIKSLFLVIVIAFCYPQISDSQALLQKLEGKKNVTFQEQREAGEAIWKDIPVDQRKGWKAFKRWEYFWETRQKEDGALPTPAEMANIIRDANIENKKISKTLAKQPEWKNLGPMGNPSNNTGGADIGVGRLNVVRMSPDNSKVIWVGAAGGGVWRSTNGGKSWETFPFTQFLSLGVSDIAISPSNSATVYVATGDADGIGGGGGNSYSIGVIKSTDDGASWTVTNLAYSFNGQKLVARLLVHPDEENNVIAATSDGIYKTTDGGNSWIKKTDDIYFKDMEFNPENPSIIYASSYSWAGQAGLFKSTDNGESWKQVKTISNANRIALTVTLANSSKVFALCASTNSAFHSLLISKDEGETYDTIYAIGTGKNILGRDEGTGSDKSVGQGWYDLCIAVAPYDEYEIVVGGINVWKSTDGGLNWNMIGHWYAGYGKPFIHADHHDLVYDDTQGYLYSANDGGIDRTTDVGVRWTNLNNGMDITQFYRLACSAKDANVIYAGSQDNGSSRYAGNGVWNKVYGGDGMDCAVDWEEPLNAYVSIYNGNLYRSTNGYSFYTMLTDDKTGENGAWVTPFIVSPVKSATLYAGYRNVWRSDDNGRNWYKTGTVTGNNTTLRSIAASPSDSNYIYTANLNQLWFSTNAGKTWTRIGETPNYISSITVHPTDPKRIWLTNEGFVAGSKVYEYDGTTMKNISGNLPNIPVSILVYQKNSPDRLYIGTDYGVYYSDYNSGYWEPYGTGMPNMIINDLEIHYGSGKLRAASYGRGIWETDINTCNAQQPKVKVSGKTVICDGEETTLEADGNYSNFTWSTGEKTKSIKVKESGIYSLMIEDSSGCIARSVGVSISVKSFTPIKINTVGSYPPCEGDEFNFELSVTMGYTKYRWSTGDSTRRIKITKPGTYSITATTVDTCFTSASFEVKVAPKPAKPRVVRWTHELLWTDYAPAYQWYLNGSKIEGATEQVYKISELGDYTVQVFDTTGCSNISEGMSVVSDVSDLTEGNSRIQIYPNPADDKINIVVDKDFATAYSVKLYNSLGNEVYSIFNCQNDGMIKSIDLNKMNPGMYNLYILTSSGNFSYKFIKK